MKSLIYLSFSFVRAERPDARLLATSNSVAGEVKHVEEFCAMYDICGARSDRKVLNCPYNIPSVKPDDLLSSKVQSLCPTITGNVCCTEDQFDTLRTQVQQVSNNLTVDGIDYYITDTFGQGLYESCKDVKFGTMNTRALDFIGGGAQNFKGKLMLDWFAFIGRRAAANLPGSPYTIKFWPSAPELSGMIPMNVSAYSCADGSLGCSCGDCTSSPVCSSTAPPPHKSSSCSVKMGSLNAKCVDFALAILYIILVSLFFGWGFFHRKRERSRSFRMKPLVNAMDGSELHSVERQKEENLPMQMLGTPRTRNRIQLSIVQGYMSNFYRKYGKWVARNPTLVLSLSMALVLLLCLGLIRFEVETRPEKLWVGPGSRAAEEKLFFDSHLAPFYRIEEIDGLRANYSGSMISLTDICMKPLGQDCATQSVLQNRIVCSVGGICFIISSDVLVHYTSTESCMSAFKGPLDPSTALGGFSGNNYSEASAFVVTYPVNNAVDREGNETKKAVAWEKAFVQLAKDELLPMVQSKNLTLAFSSESSIEEELKRESTADAITIVISYLVMFAYISLTLGDTPHLSSFYISSKVLLGLSGVVLVMLSVLGSVGFFSAIGVKSTLIIMEVIPFLVLAVGVDNMCILVHAVKRQQLELPLETRISNALVEVGPSITLASLSEVLAFAVGSFIPMPACRVFSMFAALAVLLDFLLQITAFVALIVFDFLRAEDKRVDCIPCLKLSSSYADSDKGIGQRKPGLLARYMKGYFNNISEHLRIGPPLYFVVKNYNYSSESRQTNQLCSISQCDSNSLLNEISRASLIPQSSYIAKPAASWLDDFLVWISPEAFGCCRKFTNGSYCPPDDQCFHHSDLLKDRPSTIQFKEKLPWFLNALPSASCAKGGHGAYTNSVDLKGYENGIVQASSFRTYHTPLNRQIDYVNSMRAAREFSSRVSDSLQMEIFPYSVFYMYFEQYLDIWRTALINLAIAIGAVFVVCLITTCSFWSSAIILLVLTMIVVDLMGVMAILKIQLNAVSVVNLVMAVGIAVEFCVHITHAFSVSSGDKNQRMKEALGTMGASVFSGITLTKLVGVIVLCFSRTEVFVVYYFQMYLALVLLGFLHGLVFLPVVLSVFGPPSRFHFSQTRESFNGRSTANRLLRWLWLVRKDRENCGEQNSSGGVTGNWRNNGELKRGFCDFSRLRLAAFRMLYGDKDDMEMTGITRASDQYQPWPVELPETKTKSGSGSRVGLTRLFL
ncbi:SSD domain-containing protein [Citrus sinensis]|uniref:SSD domain-containing protein n=1 Tax=Citrus sinensis TaxID=2711 RepID=A0ACB8KZA1_CITSI|nr:SSD domain-containing protein [Citrus sinensis]